MNNKTIVVALGGLVFAVGLAMFVYVFVEQNTLGIDASPIVDALAAILGALPTSYHPGIVLMVTGGAVMYFGSRDG